MYKITDLNEGNIPRAVFVDIFFKPPDYNLDVEKKKKTRELKKRRLTAAGNYYRMKLGKQFERMCKFLRDFMTMEMQETEAFYRMEIRQLMEDPNVSFELARDETYSFFGKPRGGTLTRFYGLLNVVMRKETWNKQYLNMIKYYYILEINKDIDYMNNAGVEILIDLRDDKDVQKELIMKYTPLYSIFTFFTPTRKKKNKLHPN